MAEDEDPIASTYQECAGILERLRAAGDYSAAAFLEPTFVKLLLLSAASYLESELRGCLEALTNKRSGHDLLIMNFVKNKAIERQYHTYFKWDCGNANQFFGLFGGEFLTHVKARLVVDEPLENAVKAFLKIGDLRNTLVHQNFILFAFDATAEEVFTLFVRAKPFIGTLATLFDEFANPSDAE